MAVNRQYGIVESEITPAATLKEVLKRIASWEAAEKENKYGFPSDIQPADEKKRKQELKDTLTALERQRDELEEEIAEDMKLRRGIRKKYNLD